MAQEEKKKKKKAAAREDKEDSQKVSLTHLHLPPSIRPNFGFQTLYVLRFSKILTVFGQELESTVKKLQTSLRLLHGQFLAN